MLKVLITSNYDSPNTYVKSIVDPLRNSCEVTCSVEAFWNSDTIFEIIHVQWAEELFKWALPNEQQLSELKARMQYWKSVGTRFVLTRHNEVSHRNYDLDAALYAILEENCDGVIHLGSYSLSHFANQTALNTVIEHPNYLNLVKPMTKSDARASLGLRFGSTLYLSFGTIRKKSEEQQLIDAFRKVRKRDEILYICNSFKMNRRPTSKRNPVALMRYWNEIRVLNKNGVFLESRKIPETELATYFSAADIIISPRVDSLNSGVIYLGFSFAKVVIGAAIGNMKALLEKNGNPVFLPLDSKSIGQAMRKARLVLESNVGEFNFDYAKNSCDPEDIANEHLKFYLKVNGLSVKALS